MEAYPKAAMIARARRAHLSYLNWEFSPVAPDHCVQNAFRLTFGDVKATSFTVNSDDEITATVPAAAKAGDISVTTPGGTATSSTTFTSPKGSAPNFRGLRSPLFP